MAAVAADLRRACRADEDVISTVDDIISSLTFRPGDLVVRNNAHRPLYGVGLVLAQQPADGFVHVLWNGTEFRSVVSLHHSIVLTHLRA